MKKDKKPFWASIIIMGIMIFSIAGFALMTGGGSFSSGSNQNQNVPFGQIFQNPQTGELYWGAIKNGEQFIFGNIDGYEQALIESSIANKIKQQQNIIIYVDDEFNSPEAVFLIEKALKGLKINYTQTSTQECDPNTLVFTTNSNIEGDCIKFISNNDQAPAKAEIVVYHLVK